MTIKEIQENKKDNKERLEKNKEDIRDKLLDRLLKVCILEEIKNFPIMCDNKLEGKEAIKILEDNSLEELKKIGKSIPNWRKYSKVFPL